MTTSRHSCRAPSATTLLRSDRRRGCALRTGSAAMGSTVEPWDPDRHPCGQPPTRRRRWSGHNVVTADLALRRGGRRGTARPRSLEDLLPLGAEAGTAEAREHGPAGQRAPPRADVVRPLRQPDRRGRVPPVLALADGARGRPRPGRDAVGAAGGRRPHAHLRRAAGFLAWSHTEPGHGCPISMTYAAVPALRADDALAKEWTPLLASTTYDPGPAAGLDEARRAVPAWA